MLKYKRFWKFETFTTAVQLNNLRNQRNQINQRFRQSALAMAVNTGPAPKACRRMNVQRGRFYQRKRPNCQNSN